MRMGIETRVRDARRKQSGQAMIEFAFAASFLTILVISIFELFGLVYAYNVIADSSKEGVRYAIVHGVDNGSPSGPTKATATTPPCTSSNNNNATAADV